MTATPSEPTTSDVVRGVSPLPPADYIAETRAIYSSLGYDAYRWAERPEPPAFVTIDKPLSESTIMLIGSGGVYRHGQIAFSTADDTSIRVIASDTPKSELRTSHFAYDQVDAREDPNCIFPLERLHELVDDGIVGGLTENHAGFMGGIYSTRRMLAETAELLLEQCRAEETDVVLLVPV